MGTTQPHRPVLLIAAAFSRFPQALAWFEQQAVTAWGPIADRSPQFAFTQTRFYERSMGTELLKQLFAFERLIDPQLLPAAKRLSNRWETQAAQTGLWDCTRPLNIDPGYVTEAKLVLATTKDRDHRLYLGEGIYGEVTLFFRGGAWQARPWTYPDFQLPAYHEFFADCRTRLRQRYQSVDGES